MSPRPGPRPRPKSPLSPSEAQLQEGILDLVTQLGLTAFHWPDSRRVTARGWPDLTLLHLPSGSLAFAELKDDDGRPTPDQVLVLAALRRGGYLVYLWRPDDLRNGTVERALRALRSNKPRVEVIE